jgi:hypothetical protein
MSIESELVSFLLQDVGITGLVSSRIYPEKLPEITTETNTTMPAITYFLVSENDAISHDSQNWYTARIQIDVWASSYKSAHDTAAAVHSALQGFRGSWGSKTIGGVFRRRKNDMPAPEVRLNRVSMDYMINYS